MLHHIPCLSYTLVPGQVEVPHSHLNLCLYEPEYLIPQEPSSPNSKSLNQQDCSQQRSVKKNKVPVRSYSTDTTKGSDEEEDTAKTGENDWQVEKLVTKEI